MASSRTVCGDLFWRLGAFSSEALTVGAKRRTRTRHGWLTVSTALASDGGPHPMGRQYAAAQISRKKWGGAARGGDSTAPGPETGDPAARTLRWERATPVAHSLCDVREERHWSAA